MSIRERWVVYPLLCFSLFLGLQDKLFQQPNGDFANLECQTLSIKSRLDEPLLVMSESAEGTALMRLYGLADTGYDQLFGPANADDTPADEATSINPQDTEPAANRQQRLVAELSGDIGGGYLRLFGPRDFPALTLGHDDQRRLSGILATDGTGSARSSETTANDDACIARGGLLIPWDPPETTDPPADDAQDGDDPVDGAPDANKATAESPG